MPDDRPALETDEIEITPEMIEAGMEIYSANFLTLSEPTHPETLPAVFRAIFAAMFRATPQYRGAKRP